MSRKFTILIILIIAALKVVAQDPQFTQFYAAPLYLNPAFAGATNESRIILNNRHQWTSLPRAFVTYAASFDHNFAKYNSGVGLIAMVDRAGTGGLTSANIGAVYSYKINLTNKIVLRPAVQFAYGSRNIDFYKLTFGDQLDKSGASGIITGEHFDRKANVNFFDFSSGALLHTDKYWLGVSAHHINQPNQSLNDAKSVLPIKYSLHGGAKFLIDEGPYKKSYGKSREKSITPAFMYKMQDKFDQLDLGLYFHYEPLVIGFWYRGLPVKRYEPGYGNYDAVAVLLGFKQEKFSFGYSYDLTISRLGPTNTAGSHEISLSYVINYYGDDHKKKPKMRRRDMVIPCPKF